MTKQRVSEVNQAQSNQANRALAAATPQAGEAGRIADQETAATNVGVPQEAAFREPMLRPDQIKLVRSTQVEIRGILANLPSGVASEVTATLASIDSELTKERPNPTVVHKYASTIADVLRTQPTAVNSSDGDPIDRRVDALLAALH